MAEESTYEEDFDYGQAVEDAFDSNKWRFNVKKVEEKTIFMIPMSAKNCPGLHIKLDVSDMGDAKIRCYLAEDTPQAAHVALLEVINRLNNRYRYLTLSLDSDGDILAAYDFAFFSEDQEAIRKQASTLIALLSDIMDKCIPPIMKVIWKFSDDEDEEDE